MKTLLILNAVAMTMAIVAIVTLISKWISAEKKLAKHGESKIYKNKENKK